MIFQLIYNFRQISSNIESAIALDDHDIVADLDKAIVQIWNDLLEAQPKGGDENLMLAEFFVDQLINMSSIGENSILIKKKLLDLFAPSRNVGLLDDNEVEEKLG